MTEHTLSLTRVRQLLPNLQEQFSADCPAIVITQNKQPVMSIMPYETHQSLLATIDSLQTLLKIMGTNELVEEALKNKKGPVPLAHAVSWEEFQQEFGW
jgi:hypothetical protein